ncbi:phage virion morphogenesis protein [Aestuariivirga sp. YIM B02566]|uniref:Phage virion morphogenesis protein n=1 Tax=Taklimakanibacter albus TaxID=2800327 RepID=A0ACC5R6L1_9HYPH|nr:phage virion morphogenesis protein [Aestuariivirga sp. YIM B02566]MBK1868258.1 phage virion morphogenesis protein [Aestuariivirga sp. YIM B02566]
MSGIQIEVDASQLSIIADRFNRLGDLDKHELLDSLGALGVSQTQQRIATEKRSPDGAPWAPNRRGGSILMLMGHLLGSLSHQVGSDQVSWGSNLVYAAIHQRGGTIRPKRAKRLAFRVGNQMVFARQVNIPARPYLGFSSANLAEIRETVHAWIEERLK